MRLGVGGIMDLGGRVQRVAGMALLLLLTACSGADSGPDAGPASGDGGPALVAANPAVADPGGRSREQRGPAAHARPERPSIVLVLMDDFSMDLLPTMRTAAAMRRVGAWYSHAFVVDSYCCPSRTSLMTGQYPHQTGVRTNVRGELATPLGGFEAFDAYGNAERAFNVRLQAAGYTTGFFGKFLNHYEASPGSAAPRSLPGWSEFEAVFGTAYDQWDYWTGRRGRDGLIHVHHHAAPPVQATADAKDAAYAGVRIERSALDFIRDHRADGAPYFLQVAPYAPHSRTSMLQGHYPGDPLFPAMLRDRPSPEHPTGNCGPVPCRELGWQDLPGYTDPRAANLPQTGRGAPAEPWHTGPRLAPALASRLLRDRARMVQSVDRMVQRILSAVDDDTYVVLTSDNGFHLGQMGLGVGKGTPYDSDVHVPLVVVGPGVAPGVRSTMTSNLDLASTFEELAGTRTPAYRAGRSLVETFADPGARVHDVVFFEHTAHAATRLDPDEVLIGGTEYHRIPSYVAVRDGSALLVRYDLDPTLAGVDRAWGFYDYSSSGWESGNEYHQRVHARRIALLTRKLRQFDECSSFVRGDALPQRCRSITQ